MDHADLQAWMDRYEQLWRTPGTDRLDELFVDAVTYQMSPWREPLRGLAAVATFWADGRDGPDEAFTLTTRIVAVDGDVGVVRVDVGYRSGSAWRDLWIVRLAADGRCSAFEEWPFAPGQRDGHD